MRLKGVIAAVGGVPVPVRVDPDHGFHLKASDLEAMVTQRSRALLLLTSPNNPPRAVFTREEIAAIARSVSVTICGSFRMRSTPP